MEFTSSTQPLISPIPHCSFHKFSTNSFIIASPINVNFLIEDPVASKDNQTVLILAVQLFKDVKEDKLLPINRQPTADKLLGKEGLFSYKVKPP